MTGKLDQSLDELAKAQRRTSQQQRRRNPRRSAANPPAPTPPAGGIAKTKRIARTAVTKAVQPKAAPVKGDSKIIVSNLPKDVSEQQIKEYFVQSVGPIKKVELQYGPNSQSRGIANVSFSKPEGASNAFQKLNGLLVDGRPIKIEIVVGASQAEKFIPAAKTLAERTTQPKVQPRSAASDKKKGNEAQAKAAGGNKLGQNKKRGRNVRPTKKTEAELDSEMADYFVATPAGNNENAGSSAANGEAMDEIM